MKDSKEYSRKTGDLYRRLRREYPKPEKVVYDEPVEALVYAIISENISEAEAQSAIKKIDDSFVDINDLRVSRAEEIAEKLELETPVIRDAALALTKALGAIFNKYNIVSLKTLKKLGKRAARQVLEKIEGTSFFVVNYCMLTSLQGHAIPLTKKMIEYLKTNKMVHPEADEQDIEGFLARQVSAESAYEFYVLLRRESELHKAEAKTKGKDARKAKK